MVSTSSCCPFEEVTAEQGLPEQTRCVRRQSCFSASLSIRWDSCDPYRKTGGISLNWQLLMMILMCKESSDVSGGCLTLHNQVKYLLSRVVNCLGWTLINEVLRC